MHTEQYFALSFKVLIGVRRELSRGLAIFDNKVLHNFHPHYIAAQALSSTLTWDVAPSGAVIPKGLKEAPEKDRNAAINPKAMSKDIKRS